MDDTASSMGSHKRRSAEILGGVETQRIAAVLGAAVRSAGERRNLTQGRLGARVGLSRPRISEIERGGGGTLPLSAWVALGIALDRPLAVSLTRANEPDDRLADAGHLDIQEALLRLGARHGWPGTFELRTRPTVPRRSVDVCLCDDVARRLLLLEAWNSFGDIGAAARSTDRKVAELSEAAIGNDAGRRADYSIHTCWVIWSSAANRKTVARYSAVFASRFPGSSRAWARALNEGTAPPALPGIVWWDPDADRVVEVRGLNRPG